MIRVLVVDDHPIVREGLAAALADQSELEVAGAAGSAAEALAAAGTLAPDVILLDLELGGTSGADAIPLLAEVAPAARVVVFTAYGTEERIHGALEAGARGYLLKGAAVAEIARAVRAVAAGGTHFGPGIAEKLRGRGLHPALSAREREVLRLIAAGRGNKQIARELGITERTVKFHVTSIMGKLSADNRARAVAIAAERGLLG